MSSIYLIRHGQAGSREDYDRLSDNGQLQAGLLGKYFQAHGIRFDAAYCGSLLRQRQTAQSVLAELESPPPLATEPCWNEFSLEGLWQYLAPQLIERDDEFARAYQVHASNPLLDRVITDCDIALIRAWMRGLHAHDDVEPWLAFRERVFSARQRLEQHANGQRIAVFTSATPIGLWCGNALELTEQKIFRIAGVLHNSSFTTFRLRPDELTLFTLNQTPHLTSDLRTFR